VPSDGSLPPRKLNAFGSCRWRGDAHPLAIVAGEFREFRRAFWAAR